MPYADRPAHFSEVSLEIDRIVSQFLTDISSHVLVDSTRLTEMFRNAYCPQSSYLDSLLQSWRHCPTEDYEPALTEVVLQLMRYCLTWDKFNFSIDPEAVGRTPVSKHFFYLEFVYSEILQPYLFMIEEN